MDGDLTVGSVTAHPDTSILGLGYALLIRSEDTQGRYELMQFVVPASHGPPPHRHHNEDECFYVTESSLEVMLGDQILQADPGTYIHLPRGVPHTFRNTTDRTASFLCWVVPGNLGGFFDAFKRPWPQDQSAPDPVTDEDVGKLMAAAKQFEIEILAPETDSQ